MLVAQVLQHEVQVLLDSLILQWVIEEELDEDTGAEPPDLLRVAADHEFLDLLDEVVELSAGESPVDDGTEALECIALHGVLWVVCGDDLHEGLDLHLGQAFVDRVVLDKLRGALEERVDEIGVLRLRLAEKLEDSAQKSPK